MLIIIILSLGIFRPVDSLSGGLFFNYKDELERNREPRIWEGSEDCKDTHSLCSSMKDFCATDQMARKHCPKTCDLCQPEPIKCEDHHLGCKVLMKYCNINEEMRYNCARSCDEKRRLLLKVGEDIIGIGYPQICGSDEASQSKVCEDNNELCPNIKSGCGADPRVAEMCPMSCGICTVEEPEEEEDSEEDFYEEEDKFKKKEQYQETAIEAGPGDRDDDYSSRETSKENIRHDYYSSRDTSTENVTPRCPAGCGNGECVSPNLCQCYEGWSGKSCEQAICDGGCGNGYCLNPGVCLCKNGFTGPNCQHFPTSVLVPQSPKYTKFQHGSGLTWHKPVNIIIPTTTKEDTARKAACMDLDSECQFLKSHCVQNHIKVLCPKTCRACGEVHSPQHRIKGGTTRPMETKGEHYRPINTKGGTSQTSKSKGGTSQEKKMKGDTSGTKAPNTGSSSNGKKSIGGRPCECGIPNEEDFVGKIVGGTEVKPPHKYPWQVSLKLRRSITASCSGTLINEKWVLSAAHCYANTEEPEHCWNHDDELYSVTIGEHDQRRTQDNAPYYQVIPVKRHILHPNWDCRTFQWDFALLELGQPVIFGVTENLKLLPICLPADNSKTYKDLDATVSGWGLTSEGGEGSQTLQEVSLQVRDMNCGGYKYIPITHDKMCAGGSAGGRALDSCQGDSGGPLFLPYYDGHIQIGVVSSGVGCAQDGHPGIYARITKALDWINAVTSMNHGYCLRK